MSTYPGKQEITLALPHLYSDSVIVAPCEGCGKNTPLCYYGIKPNGVVVWAEAYRCRNCARHHKVSPTYSHPAIVERCFKSAGGCGMDCVKIFAPDDPKVFEVIQCVCKGKVHHIVNDGVTEIETNNINDTLKKNEFFHFQLSTSTSV